MMDESSRDANEAEQRRRFVTLTGEERISEIEAMAAAENRSFANMVKCLIIEALAVRASGAPDSTASVLS